MEEVKRIHELCDEVDVSKWVVIDCKIETFASLGLRYCSDTVLRNNETNNHLIFYNLGI